MWQCGFLTTWCLIPKSFNAAVVPSTTSPAINRGKTRKKQSPSVAHPVVLKGYLSSHGRDQWGKPNRVIGGQTKTIIINHDPDPALDFYNTKTNRTFFKIRPWAPHTPEQHFCDNVECSLIYVLCGFSIVFVSAFIYIACCERRKVTRQMRAQHRRQMFDRRGSQSIFTSDSGNLTDISNGVGDSGEVFHEHPPPPPSYWSSQGTTRPAHCGYFRNSSSSSTTASGRSLRWWPISLWDSLQNPLRTLQLDVREFVDSNPPQR